MAVMLHGFEMENRRRRRMGLPEVQTHFGASHFGASDSPVCGTKSMPARTFISTGTLRALGNPYELMEPVTQCKRCAKDIGPGGVCRCCSRLERALRAIFGVKPR